MTWAPILSFLIALGGTFWLKKNALGPKDHPNPRSLHRKVVPRTGGLAVVLAITLGFSLLNYEKKAILSLLFLGLAAVSFLDDLYDLHVLLRLIAHLAAAAIMITLTTELHSLNFILLLIAFSWMINLYNFMDGADGLAAGMTIIGFGCYAGAAWLAGDSQFAALNFTVATAALAFLIFNFHPARIFLGDVGSIPLGFLAGAGGFLGWHNEIWPAWFPAMVFSPFIVDATLTLAKRLLRGEKIWQAHSQHYYQKLVHSGLGQRKMALFEYLLMVTVGVTSIISLQLNAHGRTIFVAVWTGIYLILIIHLEKYFRTLHAKPASPTT